MRNLFLPETINISVTALQQCMNAFEWTRSARIVCFDGYQPPLYPDKVYNASDIVKIAKDIDANVIRISMMGKLAHFYTNQWEVDDYFKEHDFLQEIIDMAHASNIRVVPYIPGAHNLPFDLLLKWHPEWIQRAYPEQPLNETLTKPHSGTVTGFICPIGTYKDFYMAMVREVIINHDVDGWYTDGWKDCYSRPVCYCPSCREMFKRDTGNDLYKDEFIPGGKQAYEVSQWYYDKLVLMVQEAHAMVRKKKRIPSMINHISGILGYQSQGPWGKDIDHIHDVMHFERKTDPYDRLASASYISLLGERAWIYAGLYSPLQFEGPDLAQENYTDEHIFPYRKELYNESFITFACGHGVNMIRANSFIFDTQSLGKQIVKDIYSTVKNNPEIYEGAKYFPFVSVLNQETERWSYKGPWFRVLVRKGIQASIFKKEDMNNISFLKQFNVLVTDDIEEDKQRKMLEYVKCGGIWVTANNVLNLAFPNAAELEGPPGMKTFMCGRGVVIQIGENIAEEDLFEAVLFGAGGYAPYRVRISSGELIPVLSTKPGLWILHLINISKHFTGTFEQGLTEIPAIAAVDIEFNLPEGVSADSAYMVCSKREIRPSGTGNFLTLSIASLEEYDAVVIKLKDNMEGKV